MYRILFLMLSASALTYAQYQQPQPYFYSNPVANTYRPAVYQPYQQQPSVGNPIYQQQDVFRYYYPGRTQPPTPPPNQERKAIVKMVGASVQGNVTFIQPFDGAPVTVDGVLFGIPPGPVGFHVHQKGDITGGCLSSGGHFNPNSATHGAPTDAIRHVGDLGNIVSDANSVANIHIVDNVISLSGPNNIIGRTLVVHQGQDDLGRTSHPDSKTTGNAGARIACGVIGIS